MLFNSIHFAIFLPVVFLLYWFVVNKNLKLQNFLLLVSSYFFYACWDWRFLFLLVFSTFLDYFAGIQISNSNNNRKKYWFWFSIVINLGVLISFKYYNFFATSFVEFISNFGLKINVRILNVILPIGISFYTFHGLSYIIDIYNNKIKPEKNFVNYGVFVSFFPLLVAGPIERATHLLPQIKKNRIFNYQYAVEGLRQILWGLFKKLVIADQCAVFVNLAFENPQEYSGSSLILVAVLFSFQIYGDFSGYSDIAIGTAKLFGIELLQNFSFPYFSRNIAEFWRRWHISLSNWFRDYLYIPLGGNRGSLWLKIRNVFIIFIVSGFWHGAQWIFLIWGLLHALFILPSVVFKTNRNHLDIVAKGKYLPSVREFLSMLITFSTVTFAFIFFRSENLNDAVTYIHHIYTKPFYSLNDFSLLKEIVKISIPFLFFISVEWLGREKQFPIATLENQFKKPVRWLIYCFILLLIGLYMQTEQTPFIYFNF